MDTSKRFFISDTHFGHANILTFKDYDGKPVRSFDDVDSMDQHMVQEWNKVVSDGDTVYHLGDVVINKKFLPLLSLCKGRKILIKGNHDIFELSEYLKYFDDVRAYQIFPNDGIICSHIPVHPSCLENRFKFNVHGHLHTNHITTEAFDQHPDIPGLQFKKTIRDSRYLNVCVENTEFRPLSYSEVLQRLGVQ